MRVLCTMHFLCTMHYTFQLGHAAQLGQLRSSCMQRTGDITYNGATFKEFVPERTSAYVTQYDVHMAELTVRETVDFSRRVQGAGPFAGNFTCSAGP